MDRDIIILTCVVGYIIITSIVSMWSVKHTKDTTSFMTGKNHMGAVAVGLLLMSEFIGPVASIGTAQGAYDKGLSVAWNSSSLGIGYLLYAFLIAPRMNKLGEYTISGALAKHYGNGIRILVSLTMAFALTTVNVSAFTGGGAALGAILHVSVPTAIWIIGIIAVVNVSFGGIRGTGMANVIHVIFKFAGVMVVAFTAIMLLMNDPETIKKVPAHYFSLFDGIGYGTFFAWLIGNIGAVFATQYVLQAISGLNSPAEAKKAAIIAAITIFPIGFIAAFIGVAAKALFPGIPSIMAMPHYFEIMSPWMVAVVASAMVASTFVTILACQLGATALMMKDFYIPLVKPDQKHEIWATRVMSVVIGLLPIPCALLVPGLIKTIFFARSLRLVIAVILVYMLFWPKLSTKAGGMSAMVAGIGCMIGWYLLGNPYGIDSLYIALVVPCVVMLLVYAVTRRRGTPTLQSSEKASSQPDPAQSAPREMAEERAS